MSETYTPTSSSSERPDGRKYWVNPEDLLAHGSATESKAAGEFASTPLDPESANDGTDGHSRREFLKLMGASFALMGTAACTRRPTENIIPYVKRPEEVIPGIANWYASTCGECEAGCGILVKTREGRPIKFEGNPHHPSSEGGLCARGQASILNLYDPDRVQGPLAPGRKDVAQGINWEDLDAKVIERLQQVRANGGRVRVLMGESTSPSTNKIIQEFLAGFSGGKRVVFEPLNSEEVLAASELSYGTRAMPRYRLDKADMLVSFGADFLGTWGPTVEFNKKFSKNRKVGRNAEKGREKKMARYVAFESLMTLSGSNADERFRVKSGDEFKVAAALAHELIVAGGRSRFAGDSGVREALAPYAVTTVASQLGIPAEAFKKTATELWENRGRSLVFGGGHVVKGEAGIALEVVVNLLNSALESEGSTIDGAMGGSHAASSYTDFTKLVADMKAGQVDALLIVNRNPVYDLPKAVGFEEALGKVGLVVDLSMQFDETARKADYVAPTSHHTETWGDASPYAGVYSIIQPTIMPLHNTRSVEESLMVWAKGLKLSGAITGQSSWHEYVRTNWRENIQREVGSSAPFMVFWENTLREGVAISRKDGGGSRSFMAGSLRTLPKLGWSNDVTLVLYPKVSVYDGRYANNGWLQELPDPVTRISWDNYASISPGFAKQLGVKEADVLRVKVGETTVEVPAHLQPGMHDQTVAIAIGYGRKSVGRVGNDVGVNAYALAVGTQRTLQMSGLLAKVEKTGRSVTLASIQKHSSAEGRPIVREASLKEYKHNPKAGNEEHEQLTTLWPKHEYPGYRWGMAIDMNSCTGCSACVVGCQSENNIPVVGKQFIASGREMHWLRIDRYYSGKVEQPETVYQPMLCQHCENAPCETVCPVLATMHDHEGLNQQVYNRCVGTRYCANNCPYKVRRFNWYTFTDVAPSLKLTFNPDVTVRTRGIMEKCTFCVQRIRQAKDYVKDHGRKVKDADLKTACQQSCPTDAIIFGNINDPESRVSQIAADPRGFQVLEELNTRPSITYLTKIRNT